MNKIEIIEVLYVFDSWTLMVRTSSISNLKSGMKVILFDLQGNEIADATIQGFLQFKEPKIKPISLQVSSLNEDIRNAKFFSVCDNNKN